MHLPLQIHQLKTYNHQNNLKMYTKTPSYLISLNGNCEQFTTKNYSDQYF